MTIIEAARAQAEGRGRKARILGGVLYEPGRVFRVVGECSLTGLVSDVVHRDVMHGWRQRLAVGEEIICLGFGPGWGSDPGYGIEWTSKVALDAGAVHCDVFPSEGSAFAYRPGTGLVEPVEES